MIDDELNQIKKDLHNLQAKYIKSKQICEPDVFLLRQRKLLEELALFVISISHSLFDVRECEDDEEEEDYDG